MKKIPAVIAAFHLHKMAKEMEEVLDHDETSLLPPGKPDNDPQNMRQSAAKGVAEIPINHAKKTPKKPWNREVVQPTGLPEAVKAAAARTLLSRMGSNIRGVGKILTKTPGGRLLAALGLAVPAGTYGIGAARGRVSGAADAVDAGMGAYGDFYNQKGIMPAIRRMVLPDQHQIASLMEGRLPAAVKNQSQFFKGAAAQEGAGRTRLGAYLSSILAPSIGSGVYAGAKSGSPLQGFAAGTAAPLAGLVGGVTGAVAGAIPGVIAKKEKLALALAAILGLTGSAVGSGETTYALAKKSKK